MKNWLWIGLEWVEIGITKWPRIGTGFVKIGIDWKGLWADVDYDVRLAPELVQDWLQIGSGLASN